MFNRKNVFNFYLNPYFCQKNIMLQEKQDFYNQRIAEIDSKLRKVTGLNKRFYIFRLLVFSMVIFFFVLFVKFDFEYLYITLTGISFVLFLFTIKLNSKSIYKEEYLKNILNVNRQEVDFLNHQFSNREDGAQFQKLNPHLADDFDLFGNTSLYQYLNRCSTVIGKNYFAEGLCNSQLDSDVIKQRQEAINELSHKIEFLQDFQTTGLFVEEKGDEMSNILKWLNESVEKLNLLRIATILFPLINIGWSLSVVFGFMSLSSLIFPFLISLAAVSHFNKQIVKAHAKLGRTAKSFENYTSLIKLIEKEQFTTTYLIQLQQKLTINNVKASRSLSSLFRLLINLDVRYNVFLALLLNSLMVFDLQIFLRLQRWKSAHRLVVNDWFSALAAVDELISYSVFTFNNHELVVFPKIAENDFTFDAIELGHPLLSPLTRVSNSVQFIGKPNVIIITGANMAGKSTFLRTISVNLILAMNGAPVCAKSFIFTPCDIMSSIKIQDSLSNNESYFYAELVRIKAVIDHVKNQPKTLVILDEILRGTNTKDKQLGSIGLLEKLISQNSVAIIATHDLEIGKLENQYPETVTNYCFEVELEDDQLVFDYKLKKGISRKLNASFLMKKMEIID